MPSIRDLKIRYPLAARTASGEDSGFVNIGLSLIILDLLIGLPVSYILTLANKRIFQYLGYEKFMRSPGGVLFSRLLFVGLNMAMVLTWAMQLVQEQREVLKEQKIKLWDERLEGMKKQVRPVRETEEDDRIEVYFDNDFLDSADFDMTISDSEASDESFSGLVGEVTYVYDRKSRRDTGPESE